MMKEAKTGYLCIAALLTMWPSRAVGGEPELQVDGELLLLQHIAVGLMAAGTLKNWGSNATIS